LLSQLELYDYFQKVVVQVIVIKVETVTVTRSDFLEKLQQDPVKLKKFLRDVMGPERRTLTGDEREHMLTVFKLIEPIRTTNNQRSFTDEYIHAGKMYDVHYFDDEIVVEEILKDEES
jgi:hypothetical protein